MPVNTSTYRQIAREAGVSLATVSFALRNRPNVSEETRQRIRAIAERSGYVPNPVFASMMSRHRRRTSQRQIRAILGCFMPHKATGHLRRHSTNKEFLAGVQAACEEEGFLCEKFIWEDFDNSPRRLFASLRARKVPGVVFLGGVVPEWAAAEEGWARYAFAAMGNPSDHLKTHYSSADHYNNAWLAMTRLSGLGYRRIGFVMLRTVWAERSNYKALSAYTGWMSQAGLAVPASGRKKAAMPPPFFVREWRRDEFLCWLDRYKPDALLISEDEPVEFLRDAGWRVPDDIGVAHLDLDTGWEQRAGIRQNNFEAGQAATHLVIDQINRSVFGVPEYARAVLITGDWFAGPSVRGNDGHRPTVTPAGAGE
ncbi:LacI family transcriptional regulator [Opitutaceae bacterium TAV5]|nr:LacI family transcriptional regulator [Opitutaceae bacterium TAV5]